VIPAHEPWLATQLALVQLSVRAFGTHGLLLATWVLPSYFVAASVRFLENGCAAALQASYPVFDVVQWNNLNFE
jgi:hypothetical protein